MKKKLVMLLFVVTFFVLSAASASAVVNDTVNVGLRYGTSALFSANLENAVGAGYEFGYYDDDRDFVSLGETEETAISMTAAGTIYMNSSGTYSTEVPSGSYRTMGKWHIQLNGFADYPEVRDAAREWGGYPAYINGEFVLRIGAYGSQGEAEDALKAIDLEGDYSIVSSTSTGVLVTVTKTTDILFEFDCSGVLNLGVRPMEEDWEEGTSTWFKGFKYAGGFSYPRVTGGSLCVINVVNLEDYVKGVIPYEMNGSWPVEALKAQAVCARTYASRTTKHLSAYGFDVCNTTDCQVYYGRGSGVLYPSERSDLAVEETAGECLYYGGELVQDAVYHASDGGATESAQYVWGSARGYLVGREDPFEGKTAIPDYEYSVTYTASQLSDILKQKGYSVGTVKNVYVSEYTPTGNVYKITFEGTGGSKTVKGDTCRTIFYSSTYNKSVKSLRFDISGGSRKQVYYVNNQGDTLTTLQNVSVISGSGTVTALEGGSFSVLSAGGKTALKEQAASSNQSGSFTITGTGSGHHVGMSQYGAKAMAELGYDYDEILQFYYTGITIE